MRSAPRRVLAPAKLNLDLRVGKPRADGFHPLTSWFVTVSLADELTFVPLPSPEVVLTCTDPSLSTGEDNLVVRAARAILSAGHATHGVQIHLDKRIPAGGGLGGGSTDAATTLRAVRELFDLPLSDSDLRNLAATLGSDVPFFLSAGSAICTGRGDHIHELPAPAAKWALLIRPDLHVATPAVYRAFDRLGLGSELPTAEDALHHWKSVSHLAASDFMARLRNDLEPAAFDLEPDLGRLRDRLSAGLNRPVRMTGSGSVLFSLFDTPDQAHLASQSVESWGLPGLRVWWAELCPSLPNPLH